MKKIANQKCGLLIISFICAILPVMAVFFYFYHEMYSRLESELLIMSTQSIERGANTVDGYINQVLDLSNRIYVDKRIYAVLETQYSSPEQFFDEYQKVIAPALKVLPYTDSKIQYCYIITDNDTVLSGDYVQRADSPVLGLFDIIDIESISGAGTYIYGTGKYFPHMAHGMMFSYVRSMDLYKNMDSYKKYIKIDLEIDSFHTIIENESYSGSIDIVDHNNIIVCSTDTQRQWKEYEDVSEITDEEQKYIYECRLSTIEGWKVVGSADVNYIKDSLATQRNIAMLLLCIVIAFMSVVIYNLVNAIFEGRLRETQIMLQKKQAELNALKNQVDPHFLFNILETVRMKLFLSGQREHSNAVMKMAKLYQKLGQWENDIVPLSNEVEFIHEFMFIQEYRYEEALIWTMKVDDNAKDFKVPKMLLHTFVENACKHGMNENGSRISIDIKMQVGFLYCRIEDNGVGFTPEDEKRFNDILNGKTEETTGIGIYNAIQRLKLYYGDRFKLTLNTGECFGSIIEIILPPMEVD